MARVTFTLLQAVWAPKEMITVEAILPGLCLRIYVLGADLPYLIVSCSVGDDIGMSCLVRWTKRR